MESFKDRIAVWCVIFSKHFSMYNAPVYYLSLGTWPTATSGLQIGSWN